MTRNPAAAFPTDFDDDSTFEVDDDFDVAQERPLPSLAELEGDPYAPPETDVYDQTPHPPALAAFDDAMAPDAFPPADPFAALELAPDWDEPSAAAPGAMALPVSNPVGAMIAGVEHAMGDADVPRITIHIFCQRPDTAETAEKAQGDRRLARATTVVRSGGLAEALDVYRNSPTPSLVMVESLDPADTLLAGLDRLAEVCDPGTKVVVIGNANDIGLYRELMRRGVSEYLVPPLQPLQLIRTISSLYADPATPFAGRTMAFVGAKGGVGSSSIAHNFAWALAEHVQAHTCIVDYDLAFGTAGLDFNQDPAQGMADALMKPDRLDPTLMDRMTARCTDRLSLFAAPATLDDDWEIGGHAYEEVGRKIRASAPYVVLDLPHLWSGWMRATLMGADDVVIVAAPDLASLRNGKNMIDLLRRGRPNDAPPRLIINQAGLPGRPEIPIKDFAKAMGVEPALVLPFDAKLFGQAANNGQMIFEVNPKAKAAEGLTAFAQALSRREAAVAKPRSVIERLMKRAAEDHSVFGKRSVPTEASFTVAAETATPPPPPVSGAEISTRPQRLDIQPRFDPSSSPEKSAAPEEARGKSGPRHTAGFEQLRSAQGDTGKLRNHEAPPDAAVAEIVREQSDYYHATKTTIYTALLNTIDLGQLAMLDVKTAAEEIRDIVAELVAIKNVSMSAAEQEHLVQDIIHDVLGYGPLEPLLARDDIADIMVNGAGRVFIEVQGKVQLTNVRFRDNAQLMNICQRIVSQVGRRVDEASPICDARLPDGSRVNVIAPPLAIDGPTLTIRKFKKDKLTMRNLVEFGSISPEGARVLGVIGASRCNVLISGGTGSGKTTLLNTMTAFIDPTERVVTCEDAAELQLQQPHVVRLETRPPNLEGQGAISMRDLVKNCLRMRPERIIVGEVRGPEAFDLLQAMNTGHDGSMGTLHANSPREAISRLESMITMGGYGLPSKTIREMIVGSIDVIIQAARLRDGSRRITHVTEVVGLEGEVVITQDLFLYEITGEDPQGGVAGRFHSTGIARPRFWDRARYYGLDRDLAAALDAAE